jgi:AcrR family transcriptional regulator
VGALTLQGIAAAAGVSKALLLYHFAGKTALLDAIVHALGTASAGRLRTAANAPDAIAAWRMIVADESVRVDQSGRVLVIGSPG